MTRLSGWGRSRFSDAEVIEPGSEHAVQDLLTTTDRPVIARGLGRSYGDPAQNAGGVVISNRGLRSMSNPGPTMTVGGGVSVDELLRRSVPAGWFIPVTPGTRYVTVAGAFASDVHGKNHHRHGAFSQHVERIRMVLADGSAVAVGADDPLFVATAGGMGLTGFITEMRIRLLPIESSSVDVVTSRHAELDHVMAAMTEADTSSTYSVAWVDSLARGRRLGRSVLTVGEHARARGTTAENLAYHPRALISTPTVLPDTLLNSWSAAAFNEMWFRKAPTRPRLSRQGIAGFFHPLDGVRGWNRVYGRRGFLQYQFVVPDPHSDLIREALESFSHARCPVFLTVLKRLGPGNRSPMSFPMQGWTLTCDIPTDVPDLAAMLDHLDDQIVAVGGRTYLAKDHRTRPETLAAMYPDLDRFRSARDTFDPDRRWRSDLSARLGL